MSERRHAAVIFTDIAGYTALMGSDESKAFEILEKNHGIHESLILKYNGVLIKEMGDGTLASFTLASDAVRCAVEIQKACKKQDIPLKIGIHEGEMVFAGADVLGDGVNIASRLQALTQTGCITISDAVYHDIRNKVDIKTVSRGEHLLKNVSVPVKIHEICWDETRDYEKKEEAVVPVQKNRKRIFIGLTTGILVLASAAAIILFFHAGNKINEPLSRAKKDPGKSIAILPFKNLSNDPDNQYFTDGIMDAVLNHLSKIKELSVTSRTTMEKYRSTSQSIPSIGREVRVAHILEGSVQKYGSMVRVTAQLINVRTDEHLWSEEYDRELKDIFSIQSEIAEQIAEQLKARLSPREKQIINDAPTSNLGAYDFLLKGKENFYMYLYNNDPRHLYDAQKLFREAINIDPLFAEGYLWLGLTKFVLLEEEADTNEKNVDSLGYYSEKALGINSNLALGYSLRSWFYNLKGEKRKAVRDINRSVEIDPNDPLINLSMGMYYGEEDDAARALLYLQKGMNLGVKLPVIMWWCGYWYYRVGDFEKARQYLENSLVLKGTPDGPDIRLYRIYKCMGDYEKAINMIMKNIDWFRENNTGIYFELTECSMGLKRFREAKEYSDKDIATVDEQSPDYLPNRNLLLGYILWGLGDSAASRTTFDNQINVCHEQIRINSLYGQQWANYDLAKIYAFLGDSEKAYYHFRKQEEFGFISLFGFCMDNDPMLESICNEPEFLEIVGRTQAPVKAERDKVNKMLEEEGLP